MSSLGSAEFGRIRTDKVTGRQFIQTRRPRGSSWVPYVAPDKQVVSTTQTTTAEVKKTPGGKSKALGAFSQSLGQDTTATSPFTSVFGTNSTVGSVTSDFQTVSNSGVFVINGDALKEFSSGQVTVLAKNKTSPITHNLIDIYVGGFVSGSTSGSTTGSTTGTTSGVTINPLDFLTGAKFYGDYKGLEQPRFISSFNLFFTGVTTGTTTGSTTGTTSGTTSGSTTGSTTGTTTVSGTTSGSTSSGTTTGTATGNTSGYTGFTTVVSQKFDTYIRNVDYKFNVSLGYVAVYLTGVTSGSTSGTTTGTTTGSTTGTTIITGTTTGTTFSGNTTGTTNGTYTGSTSGSTTGYTGFTMIYQQSLDKTYSTVNYSYNLKLDYTTTYLTGTTTGSTSGTTTGKTSGLTDFVLVQVDAPLNVENGFTSWFYNLQNNFSFTGTTGTTSGVTTGTTTGTTSGRTSELVVQVDLPIDIQNGFSDVVFNLQSDFNFSGVTGFTTGYTTGTTTGTTTGSTYGFGQFVTDPVISITESLSYTGNTSGTTSGSTSAITSNLEQFTVLVVDPEPFVLTTNNQGGTNSGVVSTATKDLEFTSGVIYDPSLAETSVSFGTENSVKGISSFVANSNNVAAGTSSFAKGINTLANATASETGGVGVIADNSGEMARSSGTFSTQGDAQYSVLSVMLETKAADEVIADGYFNMYVDNSSEDIIVNDNTFYQVAIDGICVITKDSKGSDAGEVFSWTVRDNIVKSYNGKVTLTLNPSLKIAEIAATNKTKTIATAPKISMVVADNKFRIQGYSNDGYNYRYYFKVELVKISNNL